MQKRHRHALLAAALAALIGGLAACASTVTHDKLEQRTAQAIGREVGSFSITDFSEETGGRTNYTARARDGATWRCYQYSPTGFQKAMSFGQIPDSDAICTPMARGSAPAAEGKPAGGCNALLKAAGRC